MKKFRRRKGGEEPVDNFFVFVGGGGVLPIMAYTERLRPKGVPSSFKNDI